MESQNESCQFSAATESIVIARHFSVLPVLGLLFIFAGMLVLRINEIVAFLFLIFGLVFLCGFFAALRKNCGQKLCIYADRLTYSSWKEPLYFDQVSAYEGLSVQGWSRLWLTVPSRQKKSGPQSVLRFKKLRLPIDFLAAKNSNGASYLIMRRVDDLLENR